METVFGGGKLDASTAYRVKIKEGRGFNNPSLLLLVTKTIEAFNYFSKRDDAFHDNDRVSVIKERGIFLQKRYHFRIRQA
jgi:hypothetical protein